MESDFYLRYYVGHKGKFGHEFLEFEFRPDGEGRAVSGAGTGPGAAGTVRGAGGRHGSVRSTPVPPPWFSLSRCRVFCVVTFFYQNASASIERSPALYQVLCHLLHGIPTWTVDELPLSWNFYSRAGREIIQEIPVSDEWPGNKTK